MVCRLKSGRRRKISLQREQRTGVSGIFAKPDNRIGRRHIPAGLKENNVPHTKGHDVLTRLNKKRTPANPDVSLIDDALSGTKSELTTISILINLKNCLLITVIKKKTV